MHLVELTCDGFRGLDELRITPAMGVNVIRGNNAQGKTSLLEAILYLSTSKSHRTSVDTELVRNGSDEFHIRGLVRRSDRDVALEANWWRGEKRFKVNGVSQGRISEILGKVNVILFSPEDAQLVRGGASSRRRFLDMELSQLHTGYLRALQQYRLVVRQRNELLRQSTFEHGLLDVWDAQLVEHGTVLMRERAAFIEPLAQRAAKVYAHIAAGEEMTLTYRPDIKPDASFSDVLRASRHSDIRQRLTTRGPHRDDMAVQIADAAARSFGSQGQQKSAALAIKLAEFELVRERTGEYPILMLDDVFSELDKARAERLLEVIHGEAQCLVTTTDLTANKAFFGNAAALYTITAGRISLDA